MKFLSLPERNCVAMRWPDAARDDDCALIGDFESDSVTPASDWEFTHQWALTTMANPSALNVSRLGHPSLVKSPGGLSLRSPLGGPPIDMAFLAEGKPIFENAMLTTAVLAADTLAVVASEGKSSNLWVLSVKDSAVLHQQGNVTYNHAVTLSPDGRWLARQTTVGRTVEVRAVNGGAVERLPNGGYHNAVAFHLAADALFVRVGRYRHHFWLDRVPFAYGSGGDRSMAVNVIVAEREDVPTAYDPKRFGTPVEAGPWVACYDHWGQIVLMTVDGVIVMHVCVCRGQWAVVLPDGTRCGSAALLGGAPTPDAERLVGEWLRKFGR